jgi:hypothetical protein
MHTTKDEQEGKVMELVTATTYDFYATYEIQAVADYSMVLDIEEVDQYIKDHDLEITRSQDKIQIYEYFLINGGYEVPEESTDESKVIVGVEVYR